MLQLNQKQSQALAATMERVLIVDPQVASARMLADLLHNIWPGQVWMAGTTARALELAQGVEPSLIFVECGGEGLDGLAFTRRLRRGDFSCRKAPVVMVTAQATPAIILGARDVGVCEFLRKPFTNKDLLRRVEAVALNPRGWVEAMGYVGPDRRRFNSADYKGARKRRVDTAANAEQARIVQALRIVVSACAAAESDPTQAMRALNTQATELRQASGIVGNTALGVAASELQRYLAGVTALSPLTKAGLQPHADKLVAFLPADSQSPSRSAA